MSKSSETTTASFASPFTTPTREQLKQKMAELEAVRGEYIHSLLAQRKAIDAELRELGYQEGISKSRGKGRGSKGPMSEETKQKIRESRKRKKAAASS